MAEGTRFQILSISGGGFLGLYAAAVLAELEAEMDCPLGDCFDLIAGTSVGGIVGLGIAAGVPAAAICSSIAEHGARIFASKALPGLAGNALSARYSPAPLAAAIDEIFPSNLKIGDLKRRFIAPAFNVSRGEPQVFKTAHHQTFVRDWRLSAKDVALATSAAPTIFPLHTIGHERFADGGRFANAPDDLALHEASHFLEADMRSVHVLSIGTTSAQYSLSHKTTANMGWVEWMRDQKLFALMISAQQQHTDAILRHRLGERYLRIDSQRSADQSANVALDRATTSAASDLRALAEGAVRRHLGARLLPAMLMHRAKMAEFFY